MCLPVRSKYNNADAGAACVCVLPAYRRTEVVKVLNRIPSARLSAGLIVLVTVSGCSWFHHRSSEPAVAAMPSSPQVPDSGEALPVDEMTATEAATSGAGATASAQSSPAPADSGSMLNPNAPKSYTVKRGDTLWGIATTFLRDPWLWPEVWYINPQVANPHLIYPGDTLALAFGRDGKPIIRLEQGGAARLDPRLRSSPLDGAIPTIPYSAIAAFLSRPSVLTNEQIREAPHVVAFRDEHVVAGTGHEVYIADLKATPNSRFSVVHVGDELRDPDDNKVVGYQGIYTATALVSQPGSPTKALLIDTSRETMQGDKVLTADLDVPLNFMLRAPRNDVHGRIISVIDGTQDIGQYQIVVINRGKRHGIDAGHVLAVDSAGKVVRDVYGKQPGYARYLGGVGTSFAPKVKLPDERAGTLLVFKSFDRISYALVVGAANIIRVQDVVHNP
jgi:LysM repeat protein